MGNMCQCQIAIQYILWHWALNQYKYIWYERSTAIIYKAAINSEIINGRQKPNITPEHKLKTC